MEIAIIYQDTTINPTLLSMLQSIFKMLENDKRNYQLITDINSMNKSMEFDAAIVVLIKKSNDVLNEKIEMLKNQQTSVIIVATKDIESLPPHDLFIDISPNFISYIKNGSLIYTINKVLNDIENGKSEKYNKPVLRKTVIQHAIKSVNAQTYLEIGVSNGENFVEIEAPFIIGIDPITPNQQIKQSLSDHRLYFQQKSDDFFETNKALLEEKKIDVAFIDGAHNYHQALRDFQNCLKYLNPNGLIIMHDCNPISSVIETPANTYEEACGIVKKHNISPYGYAWTGDVWKTIVNIRSNYDNLQVITLDCDFGLGVIKKANPENLLSFTNQNIEELSYPDLEKNRVGLLNLTHPKEFMSVL